MTDRTLYVDREHSFIKHKFLTKYLEWAAYKTLRHYPTFNFVDAFAGPWNVSDDDTYSDASFHQAINILEAVRIDLEAKGLRGLKVRFCLCEKSTARAARLTDYAQKRSTVEIKVFSGLFEDNLEEIGKAIPDGFTFTFLDPTGWNIRNDDVFRFLKERKGEFLLNFMAEPINRHAGFEGVALSFGRFLADPSWSEDFLLLPSEWSNEQRILHLLKSNMKRVGVATYLPDFPILLPREDRLMMRLILGTHSAYGLEVFRDVQDIIERKEMEIRTSLRDDSTPQVSLFSSAYLAQLQQKTEGVGCKVYQQKAEERIIKGLRKRPDIMFRSIALAVMEEYPLRKTHVRALLKDMKANGLVSYTLPPKKQLPQDNTRVKLALPNTLNSPH